MTGIDDDLPGDDVFDAPDIELGDDIDALLADPLLWADPPADLGDRVVAAVHSEAATGPVATSAGRTSWVRPALLGAAAVLVFLFGGVVLFSVLNGAAGTDQFSADLIPTGVVSDVGGSIEVTSFDSGLRIDLDAPSLPRRDGGRFYEGWLRTTDGHLIPVGTFHGGDGVVLWAGIDAEFVAGFTITLEAAEAPDSSEQRSSGEVVLKADLSGG